MAADAALWIILAAAIVLVTCGCYLTRRPAPEVAEERFEHEIDRAA